VLIDSYLLVVVLDFVLIGTDWTRFVLFGSYVFNWFVLVLFGS